MLSQLTGWLSISALGVISTSTQAAMFTESTEASTHDARCTKNERDSGKCGRDAEIRYKREIQHQDVHVQEDRNINIKKDVNVNHNGRGYDNRGGGYDDRRGYDNRGGGYDDRRGYDNRGGGYDDRRGYDNRGGGYDDRRGYDRRSDPNWKEKHDVRTESNFERQRRKDQEYYDKY